MTVEEIDLTPIFHALARLITARKDARVHNRGMDWQAMARDSDAMRDAMQALEESWDRLPGHVTAQWEVDSEKGDGS